MATIPKNSISFRASMPACLRSQNPKISHLSFPFFHSSPNSIPLSLRLRLRLVSHGSRRSFQVRSVLNTVQPADVSVSERADLGAELKPRVLVSEKLGDAGLELLRGFGDVDCSYDLSPEELCDKISEFDALIVRSGTKVTRQVFEAAKGRLKVVGRAGVGIDNVDLQAATEFGCLVVNAPTANTIAAAEHGIALLASMARNVAQADASTKSGNFKFCYFL